MIASDLQCSHQDTHATSKPAATNPPESLLPGVLRAEADGVIRALIVDDVILSPEAGRQVCLAARRRHVHEVGELGKTTGQLQALA